MAVAAAAAGLNATSTSAPRLVNRARPPVAVLVAAAGTSVSVTTSSTTMATAVIGPVLPQPAHLPGGSLVPEGAPGQQAPAPVAQPSSLPLTGRHLARLAAVGSALLLCGDLIVVAARRRPVHAKRKRTHAGRHGHRLVRGR